MHCGSWIQNVMWKFDFALPTLVFQIGGDWYLTLMFIWLILMCNLLISIFHTLCKIAGLEPLRQYNPSELKYNNQIFLIYQIVFWLCQSIGTFRAVICAVFKFPAIDYIITMFVKFLFRKISAFEMLPFMHHNKYIQLQLLTCFVHFEQLLTGIITVSCKLLPVLIECHLISL